MIDYIYESYFAIIGLTGHGKSTFLNAISGTESCKVSSKGKSETQVIQLVSFVRNNHRFNAIDTPGLDDSDDDKKKVSIIKEVLKGHPKIKKLILIKKLTDVRLSGSMQNAIIAFMEAFPKKNFWDHVIIVNSRANKSSDEYKEFMDSEYEEFVYKIKDCQKLKDEMIKRGIDPPIRIKEYFVDSKKISNKLVAEEFEHIKDDIKNSGLMFKEVIVHDNLERSRESTKNKGFYIITKYNETICIDFDDTKTKIETILNEEEKAPVDCEVIQTDTIEESDGSDDVRWYDVLSFGIARAVRKTAKYKVYEVKTYKVGDKKIKGEKTFKKVIFK